METILVAHPLAHTTQLLEIYLNRMGYDRVIIIENEEWARGFIMQNVNKLLGVIVSDMFPRLAGLRLAKLTKELSQEEGMKIPVVIITSLPPELGRKHWEEIRKISDGQLLEPFTMSQLEAKFRETLAARR